MDAAASKAGCLPHGVEAGDWILRAVHVRGLEDAPVAVQNQDIVAALVQQLPGGGDAGNAAADNRNLRVHRSHPSTTVSTPTAYGPGRGQVYAGGSYQHRLRYSDWHDGILVVGAGFGNPKRTVGLSVSVSLLDTYTEFAEDRSLSLKLHRQLPFRSALAMGYENVWHTDGTDGGDSRYVAASTVVLLRDRPTSALGSLVLNVGLGTDRFLPEPRFARGEDGVNAFGSVAVRLLPPVNAVANWTGQDLALGLSIAPIRTVPFVITPTVVDVTGTAGDGTRFAMSAGVSYDFRR